MATCSTNSSSARKLVQDKPMCWGNCSKIPGTSYDPSPDLPATVHLPDGEERYFRPHGGGRSVQIPIIPPGERKDPGESRSLPNESRGCLNGSSSQTTPQLQPPPPWPSPFSNHGSCVLPPPNRCASELFSFSTPRMAPEEQQKRLSELRKRSPLPTIASAASPLASFRNLAKHTSSPATGNSSSSAALKLFPNLDSRPPDTSPPPAADGT